MNLYRESDQVLLLSQAVTSQNNVWVETPLAQPVSLVAGTTYRLVARCALSEMSRYRTSFTNYSPHCQVLYSVYASSSNTAVYPNLTASGIYMVDIRYKMETETLLAATPESATFADGIWQGDMTILTAATDTFLRADDGGGNRSDTNLFTVLADPPVVISLPASASEAAGVLAGQGTVSLYSPQPGDLEVTLVSHDTSELSVPATVIIPAGENSATFALTLEDDALLDFSQVVTVTASAANFTSTSATITVLDDETTTLAVAVPASATEGDGTLAGQGAATLGMAATADVTVSLASSNPAKVAVPASVTIPAGTTSVPFDLTVGDDAMIDGEQTVAITPSAPGLGNISAVGGTMSIADNETTELTVTLPVSEAREGDGNQNLVATVRIAGTLPDPLVVTLASSDTSELTVPESVTIPAGATEASFLAQVIDDDEADGRQSGITVTATAAGFTSGSASLDVLDNELHHFSWSAFAAPQTANVPFRVTVSACDAGSEVIASFTGTAGLSAAGDNGILETVPDVTAEFSGGTWTGCVAVNVPDPNVVLTARNGGVVGCSAAFAVVSGPLDHFDWDTVASPRVVGTPFPASLAAKDANGHVVATFAGPAELSSLPPDTTQPVRVLASLAGTDLAAAEVGEWNYFSAGYRFVAHENLVVSHVRNLWGTEVRIWTDDGTLLASQTCPQAGDGNWTETALGSPLLLEAGRAYRIDAVKKPLSWSTRYYQDACAFPLGLDHIRIIESCYSTESASQAPFPELTTAADLHVVGMTYRVQQHRTLVGHADPAATGRTNRTEGYVFTPSVDLQVTHLRHCWGTKFSIWEDGNSVPLLAKPVDGPLFQWQETDLSGNEQIVLRAGRSYRIAACAEDSSGPGHNYGRWNAPPFPAQIRFGTIAAACSATGDAYPANDHTESLPCVDIRFVPLSAPLTPATAGSFVGGVWSGEVTVLDAGTLCLTADDGMAHTGSSNLFTVESLPGLALSLPDTVTEGDGVLLDQGRISLASPAAAPCVVTLVSSDPTLLAVPSTVTIATGETAVTFDLTANDNITLEGIRTVLVTAAAAGFADGTAAIQVLDNETTTVTVLLPATAREGDGILAGQGSIALGLAPATPLVVAIVSDDVTEATVPASVTVPPGRTTVSFDLTIVDDQEIDGVQTVTVTPQAIGLAAAAATMQVEDNEDTTLTVSLPASVTEGDGTLADAGTVTISGTLAVPLVVTLASDHADDLAVPATATIPAGATSATFDLVVGDDADCNGTRTGIAIQAATTGFTPGTTSIDILDNDLHHFLFAPIATQMLNQPFPVTVEAVTIDGQPASGFAGAASISGSGTAGAVSLVPATTTAFANGNWSGELAITTADTLVVLMADDGAGHTGESAPFDVRGDIGIIRGTVWHDVDGNAEQDTGDGPLAGWRIYLDLDRNGVRDDGEPSALSDPAGQYTIPAEPGTYRVAECVESGHMRTFPPVVPATNAITYRELHKQGIGGADGLRGCYHSTVSPDGQYVYTCGYLDNNLGVHRRDESTGKLTFVQVFKDGVGGVDGLYYARCVATSPDGRHVYAVGYYDNAVAMFSRSETDGTLTYLGIVKNGTGGVTNLSNPTWVAVSPEGTHVYVTAASSCAVATFSRDNATGLLTYQNAVTSSTYLDKAQSIALSPDGLNAYVASSTSTTLGYVLVYSRNTATGKLTQRQTVTDSSNKRFLSVAAAPDGRNVYVVTGESGALTTYTRNQSTGNLTFLEIHKDGMNGVDGLYLASGLAISPDGNQVYTTADYDGFATFTRNSDTGALTWRQVFKDGVGGVDGLASARSVTPSPDGRNLYCSSYSDNALSIFSRDTGQDGTYLVKVVAGGTVDACDFGNTADSLTVSLPAAVAEGDGTVDGAGTVTVGAPVAADLLVSLLSSSPGEVAVPANVTIPAGQNSATFPLFVMDDAEQDGTGTATITASAPGYRETPGQILVHDNDVHHFVWAGIASPRTGSIGFEVTVTAVDAQGNPLPGFSGTATLAAVADGAPVPCHPTATTAFTAGSWTGAVAVDAIAEHAVLTAVSGTSSGTSAPFVLMPGPFDHFDWSAIPSPQYANYPFAATLVARDANGHMVADYSETVNLAQHRPTPTPMDSKRQAWAIARGCQLCATLPGAWSRPPRPGCLLLLPSTGPARVPRVGWRGGREACRRCR